MVYTPSMPELSAALIVSAFTLLAVIVLIFIVTSMARRQVSHPESLARVSGRKAPGDAEGPERRTEPPRRPALRLADRTVGAVAQHRFAGTDADPHRACHSAAQAVRGVVRQPRNPHAAPCADEYRAAGQARPAAYRSAHPDPADAGGTEPRRAGDDPDHHAQRHRATGCIDGTALQDHRHPTGADQRQASASAWRRVSRKPTKPSSA